MTPDQYMAQLDLPEIYRVGGSVRDEILGRSAKDSDYMVRGTGFESIAHELREAGAKISPLKLRGKFGRQIGWRAKVKGVGVLEVVVPRTEVSTGPGRHDFDIVVDSHLPLEEDARRRDFTMNALYRNVQDGSLVDPLGTGIVDLKNSLIATTHENSFRDDPLRILRALRFVSTLGFKLEPSTDNQMVSHADAVTGLTQAGVSGTALSELERILMGAHPGKALKLMADTGVMEVLLPELGPMIDFPQRSRYHEKTTSDHTFDAVQAAANMHTLAPLRVRMALLFHDCGKPLMFWTDEDGLDHYYALSPKKAVEIGARVQSLEDHETVGARQARTALNRLNAPKKLTSDVVTLIERHMLPLHENLKPFKVRKWRAELGDEMMKDLITHRACDVIGKGGSVADAFEVLGWIEDRRKEAAEKGVPVSTKQLKVNGNDLIDLGIEGRDIGRILDALLYEVLGQPELNEREWLLRRANALR